MAMVTKVCGCALLLAAMACVPLVPSISSTLLSILPVAAPGRGSAGKEPLFLEAAMNLTGTLPPGQGCAQYDIDNYKPADADKCYLRMYMCHDNAGPMRPANHNTGDIAWALGKECASFGSHLHIVRVEVARAMLDDVWGLYAYCNQHTCGCPPQTQTCDAMQSMGLAWSNVLGWRKLGYIPGYRPTCPCYQFSMSSWAEGDVDNSRAEAFIADSGYRNKAAQSGFQWKFTSYEKTVPISSCFSKYIDVQSTVEDKIAAFQEHVLGSNPSPGCGRSSQLLLNGTLTETE